MPWFRNSLPAAAGLATNIRSSRSTDEVAEATDKLHLRDPLARRAITLVTHHQQSATEAATSSLQDDEDAEASSPPVSSSRRSPSPNGGDHEATTPTPMDDDLDVVVGGSRFGPIRHSPKMVTDVWRPY